MKNLMITLGILILMTMGMLYDLDSTELVRSTRQLDWVCEEMAEAAGYVCMEGGSWEQAEAAAEEILQRNLAEKQDAAAAWNLEKEESSIRVRVDLGEADLRLSFLRGLVNLSGEAEYDMMRHDVTLYDITAIS